MSFIRSLQKTLHSKEDLKKIVLPLEADHDDGPAGYLAVATVIRNEARYVPEWLAFYRRLGVDKVLLYDNGEAGDMAAKLEGLVEPDFAEIIPWPNFTRDIRFYHLAFAHAMSYCARRIRWLAVLDVDEFLFPTVADDLPSVLRAFESVPSVPVFWKNFGTGGHVRRPDGLVIENFTRRNRLNDKPGLFNVKSIAQSDLIREVIGAHQFSTGDVDRYSVPEVKRMAETPGHPFAEASAALQLNHYYSRSREEFDQRLAEGWGRNNPELAAKRTRNLATIEADEVEDTAIFRFVDDVKAIMRSWEGSGRLRRAGAAPEPAQAIFSS